MTEPGESGTVSAPGLDEVAGIWWDVERTPDVAWDASGRRFRLVDPQNPSTNWLHLAAFHLAPAEPEVIAHVLAEGLAACDFPPHGRRAAADKVIATLAAYGRPERPIP